MAYSDVVSRRSLAASDYKTLVLAALGGALEFYDFIIFVFFVGDILMSARLVLVGALATFDRFHRRNFIADPNYRPRVAVLIPAYNEEKVIERTVRSVLESDYPNLRAIVIDDGSSDRTVEVTYTLDPQRFSEVERILRIIFHVKR